MTLGKARSLAAFLAKENHGKAYYIVKREVGHVDRSGSEITGRDQYDVLRERELIGIEPGYGVYVE